MSGFPKSKLPFRYLGVPLRTMRLSNVQHLPLFDKMLNRITFLMTRLFPCAQRFQLIKSVLISL